MAGILAFIKSLFSSSEPTDPEETDTQTEPQEPVDPEAIITGTEAKQGVKTISEDLREWQSNYTEDTTII